MSNGGKSASSGHAVGLDIIERPVISLDDETVLQPGMVVAAHPIFSPHPKKSMCWRYVCRYGRQAV